MWQFQLSRPKCLPKSRLQCCSMEGACAQATILSAFGFVLREGFEPSSPGYKPGAFTCYTHRKFCFKKLYRRRSTICRLFRCFAHYGATHRCPPEGVEPSVPPCTVPWTRTRNLLCIRQLRLPIAPVQYMYLLPIRLLICFGYFGAGFLVTSPCPVSPG